MPPRHSARITSIISPMRRPRLANGCSSRSNSSFIQPAPMPRPTRLFDRNAAVPTALATTNGLRNGSTYTLVRKRRFVVTDDMAPIATHGSGQSSSGENSGFPSGVYGYSDDRYDG